MVELDAFHSYLVSERGNKSVSADHIVSEVRRVQRWLEIRFALAHEPFAWHKVSDKCTTRYLYELAGYKSYTDQATLPLPTRVRRVAQRLNIWFEYLQKVDALDDANPIHAVIEPRRPKHRSVELTAEEIGNLIRAVLTESRSHGRTRNWALVSVMLNADLFPLDLSQLKEEHIGFFKGLPIRIDMPGAEPCTLPPEAAAALQQWLIERRTLLAELGKDSADVSIWLITAGQKLGQPLHKTALHTIFRRYQRMARHHSAAANAIQFRTEDGTPSVSGAQGLERAFYSERRTFMHKLLEHSSPLWAGSEPSRAVLLQQESGRYLYGHAVHQVPLRHLYKMTLGYERLAAQQQQLLRTLKLDDTGRKFQLPGWFDDIVRVDIEPVARVVSERFRRKNLLSHYQKIKEPDNEVLALITWLEGVKDDYLRVRKHFDNYYAHLHREQDSGSFRVSIPDVGVIVTSEDVVVEELAPPKRTERIDKVKMDPEFILGSTWFYGETKWERAKTQGEPAKAALREVAS